MASSIVLLSPGQPSSNPRLVKEAIALAEKGYEVTVLYCYWVGWADKGDSALFRQYPGIRFIRVGGHPVFRKKIYWFTRLRQKGYRIAAGLFPGSVYFQQRAGMRCYHELKNAAAAHRAQLYIAHNLGALAPAALSAKRNKSLYAFDAEDYHRGQSPAEDAESRAVKLIEDRYLPGVAYCTAASPLIASRYKEHYPGIDPVVINNVFSIKFIQPAPLAGHPKDPLKLFWFSQTVGPDRGLETLIAAMGRLCDLTVNCTILGYCSPLERQRLLSLALDRGVKEEQIDFKAPVPPDEVFGIAARHHIGLALETGRTENRRVALTNKIFTYPLAGLAIIATDIPGQQNFLETHPGAGSLYPDGDDQALALRLESFARDPEKLYSCRMNAWELARTTLNWENEQLIFLEAVSRVIHRKAGDEKNG